MAHWAYLNDEGMKLWGDVFPKGVVPVTVLFQQLATLGDSDEQRKVFLINEKELTSEQIEKILNKLSAKFNAPKEAIKKEMMANHLPLRAELTNGSGTDEMRLFV